MINLLHSKTFSACSIAAYKMLTLLIMISVFKYLEYTIIKKYRTISCCNYAKKYVD